MDIATAPASHFAPLLALLPALQAPLPKAPKALHEEADGSFTYAPMNLDAVSEFIQVCYQVGVVLPVDWSAFVREFPFHERPHLIDGFDREQCCHALTALVRGDRFTDGLVDEKWRNGTLARLVGRLKEVLEP